LAKSAVPKALIYQPNYLFHETLVKMASESVGTNKIELPEAFADC